MWHLINYGKRVQNFGEKTRVSPSNVLAFLSQFSDIEVEKNDYLVKSRETNIFLIFASGHRFQIKAIIN